MEKCPKCGKRFPTKIEESALNKSRASAPDDWEKRLTTISKKICTCPQRLTSVCSSSEHPPDLQ